jgi:hypothetical protein
MQYFGVVVLGEERVLADGENEVVVAEKEQMAWRIAAPQLRNAFSSELLMYTFIPSLAGHIDLILWSLIHISMIFAID